MSNRQVAIVTGGSRGLGKLVVERLSGEGYTVATCSRSSNGPNAGEQLYRSLDVSHAAAVQAFVTDVLTSYGRIDVLINNAGYANTPSPIQDTPEDVARHCFETNVLGPYSFMRCTLPTMLQQPEGGVIVNVSSRAGITPVPRLAAYSSSSSALVSLTLAVAKEVGDQRILCVTLCPSGIRTGLRESVFGHQDAERQQDPKEVTNLICEIAFSRRAQGVALLSGEAVLVTKEFGTKILEWPRDERGFHSLAK